MLYVNQLVIVLVSFNNPYIVLDTLIIRTLFNCQLVISRAGYKVLHRWVLGAGERLHTLHSASFKAHKININSHSGFCHTNSALSSHSCIMPMCA